MDDDDLEALIARSLHRKAESLEVRPADWHDSATPHRASRVAIGSVSLVLLAAALVGLQFARSSEQLEPSTPATAPAVATTAPLVLSADAMAAAAVAQGYGWASSPASAWTADCLKAAGASAEYDDSTGAYTTSAGASEQLACTAELGRLAGEHTP